MKTLFIVFCAFYYAEIVIGQQSILDSSDVFFNSNKNGRPSLQVDQSARDQIPQDRRKQPKQNRPNINSEEPATRRPFSESRLNLYDYDEYNHFDRHRPSKYGSDRRGPSRNSENYFHDEKPVTKFAWNLFQKANSPQNANYVICPLSPQILLSYLAYAADGETKQEIVSAIDYNGPSQLERLTTSMLQSSGSRELNIATAFFVADDLKLNENYLKKAVDSNVDVFNVDFKDALQSSRTAARWIYDKTKGALGTPQVEFSSLSRMVLTSAVYFKSSWIYKFPPASPGTFYPTPGNGVPAEMMEVKLKSHWAEISDIGSWVAIPYNSSDSMVIVLPNEDKTVDDLIKEIDVDTMYRLMTNLSSERTYANVNLTLPKFRVESSFSLIEPLQNMGVQSLFNQNAKLPFLTKTEQLYVSDAQQKTVLEVNESGSVAVSLTSFNVIGLSLQLPVPDIVFTVNRPFLAIIVNREKYFPYFMAKITNPSTSA